jgi:hypothetical protein
MYLLGFSKIVPVTQTVWLSVPELQVHVSLVGWDVVAWKEEGVVPSHLILVISDHARVRAFRVDGAVGLRLRAAAGVA